MLLQPQGRIDLSNAEVLKEILLDGVASAKTALIIDLSQVDYVSTGGLRSLLVAFRAAKAASKGFGIAALGDLLAEIFTITGFTKVFPIFATPQEAVAALTPSERPA